MGAEPWSYFVPYQKDVGAALEALKQREFEAGRFRMLDPRNPPATIDEAFAQMGASGTGTVLDMFGVSDEPWEIGADNFDFGMVKPMASEQLVALFGTEKPTREMIERDGSELWEWIDRGLGAYIVAYDGDQASELFFAGYSLD